MTLSLVALLPTSVSALDLELGIGYSFNKLYTKSPATAYNVIDEQGNLVSSTLIEAADVPDKYNGNVVGRIVLSHDFEMTDNISFTVFGEHISVLENRDWQANGINIVGTSLKFKIF